MISHDAMRFNSLTPANQIVEHVVRFEREHWDYEFIVEIDSFDEHPGEYDSLGVLDSKYQQLTHHPLNTVQVTHWYRRLDPLLHPQQNENKTIDTLEHF